MDAFNLRTAEHSYLTIGAIRNVGCCSEDAASIIVAAFNLVGILSVKSASLFFWHRNLSESRIQGRCQIFVRQPVVVLLCDHDFLSLAPSSSHSQEIN
jgi:hypothetical protein